MTDPRGANTTNEHDAFGNLTKVTDDNNFTTTYTYTTRLELDTVTRDGEVTDIDYDLLGRKTSLDDPDMGEWSYTYFDNGWLKTQEDARTKTLTFAYDDAGRMTSKKYGTVIVAQWSYDTAGRLDQSKSWTDTGGLRVTIDYDYETVGADKRGRLTQAKWTTRGFGHGTDTYTIDYTYDNADRAYQIDLPTGETITTDYSTRSGTPIGLDGDDTYLDDATWNGQRRLTYGWSQEGSNAKLYRRWEWSSVTLQLWRYRAGTTSWGTQVADVRHWWTGAGDVTRLRDARNSDQNQCFTYDLLGRLTEAYTSTTVSGCDGVYDQVGNGPYHYSYDYKNNGNIEDVTNEVTSTTQTYTYGAGTAGPHAVTSMGGVTYEYDANGNQDKRGSDVLTWDASNRLEKYDPPGAGSTKFIYDADGTRIVRLDPDGTSTTSVGGVYEIVQGGTNDIERVTYRFAGAAVAVRTIEGTTETVDWIITDHLGSTAITRDGTTGATVRQWYAPFGAERASTGGALPTEETYTGQVSDTSTGLMHYNARYYDPELRRFISADTIVPNPADPADLNRFSYVRNNPLRYTDPSGHCWWVPGSGDSGCPGAKFFRDHWDDLAAAAVCGVVAATGAGAGWCVAAAAAHFTGNTVSDVWELYEADQLTWPTAGQAAFVNAVQAGTVAVVGVILSGAIVPAEAIGAGVVGVPAGSAEAWILSGMSSAMQAFLGIAFEDRYDKPPTPDGDEPIINVLFVRQPGDLFELSRIHDDGTLSYVDTFTLSELNNDLGVYLPELADPQADWSYVNITSFRGGGGGFNKVK